MGLIDAAIPVTVTDTGRAKILASPANESLVAEVVFGAGRQPDFAKAAGVAAPVAPPVSLRPAALTQIEDLLQFVVQQGETVPYDVTELAVLDGDGVAVLYTASAAGTTLFRKSAAPSSWTFVGRLLNLPPGANVRFDVDIGYFVADRKIHGVVRLASLNAAGPSQDVTAVTPDILWRLLSMTNRGISEALGLTAVQTFEPLRDGVPGITAAQMAVAIRQAGWTGTYELAQILLGLGFGNRLAVRQNIELVSYTTSGLPIGDASKVWMRVYTPRDDGGLAHTDLLDDVDGIWNIQLPPSTGHPQGGQTQAHLVTVDGEQQIRLFAEHSLHSDGQWWLSDIVGW